MCLLFSFFLASLDAFQLIRNCLVNSLISRPSRAPIWNSLTKHTLKIEKWPSRMFWFLSLKVVLNLSIFSISNWMVQNKMIILPRFVHTVIRRSLYFGFLHTGFPLKSIRQSWGQWLNTSSSSWKQTRSSKPALICCVWTTNYSTGNTVSPKLSSLTKQETLVQSA